MKSRWEKSGHTSGGEDLDELLIENITSCYIEKMGKNEYCLGFMGASGEPTTIFIGNWPENAPSRGGLLKINVFEDAGLRCQWNRTKPKEKAS